MPTLREVGPKNDPLLPEKAEMLIASVAAIAPLHEEDIAEFRAAIARGGTLFELRIVVEPQERDAAVERVDAALAALRPQEIYASAIPTVNRPGEFVVAYQNFGDFID